MEAEVWVMALTVITDACILGAEQYVVTESRLPMVWEVL
jgi:hypothetical protein